MEVNTTSNMFIMLAEARSRAGVDMEDIARDLATACKAVMAEGLGTDRKIKLVTEFARLAFEDEN